MEIQGLGDMGISLDFSSMVPAISLESLVLPVSYLLIITGLFSIFYSFRISTRTDLDMGLWRISSYYAISIFIVLLGLIIPVYYYFL